MAFGGMSCIDGSWVLVDSSAMDVSTECQNCGVGLQGAYCHQCGQRALDLNVSIFSLAQEFLQELFEVDGRIFRTMPALFLWPHTMVKVFLSGRRQCYSSPIRVYVFSLLVAFFCFNYASSRGIERYTSVLASQPVEISGGQITFHLQNEEGSDNEPVNITLSVSDSDVGNTQLTKLEGMNQQQALRIVVGSLFDAAPTVVNIMVPILALCLKLVYRETLLINHLVLSIVLHAVGLVLLGGAAVLGWPVMWAVAAGVTVLHLAVAMGQLYNNEWWRTGLKLVIVVGVYGMMSVLGLGMLIWLAVLNL